MIDKVIKRVKSDADMLPFVNEEDREMLLGILSSLEIGEINDELERQSKLEAVAAYLYERYRNLSMVARNEADEVYDKLVMTALNHKLNGKETEWKVKSMVRGNADYRPLDERASAFENLASLLSHIRWAVLTRFKSLEQLSNNQRQDRKGSPMSV